MAVKPISVKQIAKLSNNRELRITSLNGEENYDIREWKGEQPQNGVRLTEEELKEVVTQAKSGNLNKIGDKDLFEDKDTGEYVLAVVYNGRTYTRSFANREDIDIIDNVFNPKQDEEKPKAKRGRKPKETKKDEKKSSNIIQFIPRKEKPILENKLVTDGEATYEMCCDKLNKEMETYTDADSQYVINGIKELCKVDSDFCNNVIREDKTYLGAMQYIMDMCRKGYGDKIGNGYSLDRDAGLGMVIDYYNSQPEPIKNKTKKEA